MKVYEVGLVCEFEGGQGVLIADSDTLYTDVKFYLLGALSSKLRGIDTLHNDNSTSYEKEMLSALKKETIKAQADIKKAYNIAALRQIKLEESCLRVMIQEREIIGGDK